MIKSIYVKPKGDEEFGEYIQNEVCLSEENSASVKDMVIGETVEVEMRVVGIKEVEEDGRVSKKATLMIPVGGDKAENNMKVGDAERKMYP